MQKIIYIDEWLEEIYKLSQNDIQQTTDKIFQTIDFMLINNQEEMCDKILSHINVEKIPTSIMRSLLTITAAAKEKLKERPALFQKIKTEMIKQKGTEKTQRILNGLD